MTRHADTWPDRPTRAAGAAPWTLAQPSEPILERNHALMLTIPGIGPVTAATILAELPNIAEFTPKALAAFAGLQEIGEPQRRATQGGRACPGHHDRHRQHECRRQPR